MSVQSRDLRRDVGQRGRVEERATDLPHHGGRPDHPAHSFGIAFALFLMMTHERITLPEFDQMVQAWTLTQKRLKASGGVTCRITHQ